MCAELRKCEGIKMKDVAVFETVTKLLFRVIGNTIVIFLSV